ncbi:MAG: hypothetical protein LUB59_05605 [Candidatus Gastranaerophilales bacterium]|nr:hypothetical protein [Candidatus Gastranaerophilales bacterium]
MSIFSFFNFKSKLKEVFSQENITELLNYVKSNIIEQVKNSIDGAEKKSNVDNAVITFIKTKLVSSNVLVNVLVNVLTEYVPVITQCIYDYLKKYVDGLTEV